MPLSRREVLKLGIAAAAGAAALDTYQVETEKGFDQIQFYTNYAIERFQWLGLHDNLEKFRLDKKENFGGRHWEWHKSIVGLKDNNIKLVIPYPPESMSIGVVSLQPGDGVELDEYGRLVKAPHRKLVNFRAKLTNKIYKGSKEGTVFYLKDLHQTTDLEQLPGMNYQWFEGISLASDGKGMVFDKELMQKLRFDLYIPDPFNRKLFAEIGMLGNERILDPENYSLGSWSEHIRSLDLVGGKLIEPYIDRVYDSTGTTDTQFKYYIV